jgi:hypothetical protein
VSVRLGSYVGANLQIDRFVVGVEADAAWTPRRAEDRRGSFYPSDITIFGTPLGGGHDLFGIRLPWEAAFACAPASSSHPGLQDLPVFDRAHALPKV